MFVWQVLYGNLQKALESFDGTLRDPLMRSWYTPQRHGQAGRGICDIEKLQLLFLDMYTQTDGWTKRKSELKENAYAV